MLGIKPKLMSRWQVLNSLEVEKIHEATIKILTTIGIEFKYDKTKNIFRNSGAKVVGDKVYIPRYLVEETLENMTKKMILRGRHYTRDCYLGEGRVHYTSCFGPTKVRDPWEDTLRLSTIKDLQKFTFLSDALDNISCCLFHVRPSDISPGFQDLYSAAEMLKITDKHIHFSQDDHTNTDALIEIGSIAASDANVKGPVFSLGGCSTTPLVFNEDVCKKFHMAVPKSIPFFVVSSGVAGATSPVSLAGTLAVQNAEVLAGFTLGFLLSPNAQMAYGSFSGGMDMITGKFVMGGVELALMQAATAQICDFYGIPFGYGSGGWTDAFSPSIQAGVEKGTGLLAAALSGVEVIHSSAGGMLAGADIADYIQMMIDDDICNVVNRYLKGIIVNEDTVDIDLINDVGHGGYYIDKAHTAKFFRSEHLLPRIFGRNIELTEATVENAVSRLDNLLNAHEPNRLSDEACKDIDMIVSRAVEKKGL